MHCVGTIKTGKTGLNKFPREVLRITSLKELALRRNELTNLPKEIGFLNGKKLSQIIDASYTGTSESLAKNSRPNVTIEIPKVDARHLGMLFMLFEFQVALLGLLYKVDAFDQPGVEEGKLITKKLLS